MQSLCEEINLWEKLFFECIIVYLKLFFKIQRTQGLVPVTGNDNPLHSCLENPMDRGAWRATVHGVTRVGHDLATKEREIALVSTELVNGVFQRAPVVKNPPTNAGDARDVGSIPALERLEEEMTTHSSILAWEIPWTEEPDGLKSMGSQRVGHD